MKYTNINITSPTGFMKYYFEYQKGVAYSLDDLKYTDGEEGVIRFIEPDSYIQRYENEWYLYKNLCFPYIMPFNVGGAGSAHPNASKGETRASVYLPESYRMSKLNLYFPRFSVETYNTGVKYALTINTWIHGVCIYLGCYFIDRNDVIATDKIRTFDGEEYYEYLPIDIIDPWDMTYSDEWKPFRQHVCGEKDHGIKSDSELTVTLPFPLSDGEKGTYELNNNGSCICVTLHPIKLNSDKDAYIEMDDYHGGQNSINLSEDKDDYLAIHMEHNINEVSVLMDDVKFEIYPTFNQSYVNRSGVQTEVEFKQYLLETYLLRNYKMNMEFIVQDNDDVYKYVKRENINTPWQTFTADDIRFDNWDGFKEGLFINAILSIVDPDTDDDVLIFKTDKLFLTQNIFKYIVGYNPASKILLDAVNMTTYQINAVNKIQQNVIQMDRPDDYKANIIKPVFFRSQELASIVVHPAVTEQICLNLDQYKSKVSTFMLKIEDTTFAEIGRNNSGVLFSIVGNRLPNEEATGVYYILTPTGEMVTSGKYTYE